MRLRGFLIIIGALLIALTYSFPYWQPLLRPVQAPLEGAFPGLTGEEQAIFASLPRDQQDAYYAVSEVDPNRGAAMLRGALVPTVAPPEDEEPLPVMVSPIVAANGTFGRLDAVRWGQGEVNIYQGADDAKILRLQGFSVANGPELQILLSVSAQPRTPAEMRLNDLEFEVGRLTLTQGAQNYLLPADLDLRQYASVVIYSAPLDMIYAYAPLFLRL